MAGNPKIRARYTGQKQLVRHVERIPHHVWKAASDVEKIKMSFGMGFEDVYELQAKSWEEADLHEKTLKIRVWEVLMKYGQNIQLDKSRDARQREMLDQLRGMLDGPGES